MPARNRRTATSRHGGRVTPKGTGSRPAQPPTRRTQRPDDVRRRPDPGPRGGRPMGLPPAAFRRSGHRG
jgi:hypothetical protein